MNQVSAYLRHFLDAFLERVEGEDEAVAAARRVFVGGHLAVTASGLSLMPLLVALRGTIGLAEALTFAWLAAPLGAALLAARTGDLLLARLFFCGLLAGFIVWVAMLTGGASSGAVLWLALLPIEASLANSRRLTAFAAVLALAAWGGLSLVSAIPFVPRAAAAAELAPLLPLLGLLYAAALGIRLNLARRLEAARTGGELQRYRRLAEGGPDLVTEHGTDGGVLYASPAAEAVLAARPAALAGVGLLERIHIGDRPAWLTALSRALAKGESAAATVRIRVGDRAKDGGERFAAVEMLCRRVFDAVNDRFAVVAFSRPCPEDPTSATADSSYDDRVVRIGAGSPAGPSGREQRVEEQPVGKYGHRGKRPAAQGAGGAADASGRPGAEREGIPERRRA